VNGVVTQAVTPSTAEQTEPTQPSQTQAAATAPQCTSPAALSPALTEGPYFKANSPERTSLLDTGMPGTKLTLTGYILTADCKPVANALLDFWQANAQGQYDNQGYTLRGHQFTDANGYYHLETVVPGLYPGRTEHIHVKVQAPNGPILTTQLFFPGVANNQSDGIFDPGLVIQVTDTGSGLNGTFNFIVSTQ
jgi:protocatechuate 3,4-dioxygenase beta subunit